MRGARIYVDVDDVLSETTREIARTVERLFGKRVPFESLRFFDLGRSFDLDREQHASLMREIHQTEWLEALEPVPGCVETLRRWSESGAEVDVVTGRPPSATPASRRWLSRHRVAYTRFDSLDKYGRHAGPGGDGYSLTLEALSRRPFDLAIEDSLEMAARLAAGSALRVLLVDRPWNRDASHLPPELGARIERVAVWSEISDAADPVGAFSDPP